MKTKKQSVIRGIQLKESFIPQAIEQLDFSAIRNKLMNNDEGEKWTFEEFEIAEREYKRFLTLVKLNPKKEFVPTKLMDEFWHHHILDTMAYQKDCQNVFGFFLHHYPYLGINGEEDRKKLEVSFDFTSILYFQTFGEDIKNSLTSRCGGHACHVESDCACRVSGACKNH